MNAACAATHSARVDKKEMNQCQHVAFLSEGGGGEGLHGGQSEQRWSNETKSQSGEGGQQASPRVLESMGRGSFFLFFFGSQREGAA